MEKHDDFLFGNSALSSTRLLEFSQFTNLDKRLNGGRDNETTLANSMKKCGRKPVATVSKSKRQMQNREAQRVFRERKMKEQQRLHERIKELEYLEKNTLQENFELKRFTKELKAQNDRLQYTLNMLQEKKMNNTSADFVLLNSSKTMNPLTYTLANCQRVFRYKNVDIPKKASEDSCCVSAKSVAVNRTAPKVSKVEFQSLSCMDYQTEKKSSLPYNISIRTSNVYLGDPSIPINDDGAISSMTRNSDHASTIQHYTYSNRSDLSNPSSFSSRAIPSNFTAGTIESIKVATKAGTSSRDIGELSEISGKSAEQFHVALPRHYY